MSMAVDGTSTLWQALCAAYAVLDGTKVWSDALAEFREAMSLDACSLIRAELDSATVHVIAASGYDEVLRQRLRGALASPDVALMEPLMRSEPGSVWLDGDLCDSDLQGTTFWQAWIAPQGFRAWGCAVVSRDASTTTYLEFLGRRERLPFGEATMRMLELLTPHVRRVLTLSARPEPPPAARVEPLNPPELAGRAPGSVPSAFELGLRTRYKLTRAEARLASCLARGLSLKAAADQLCVSLNTARTHVARVYDKTGTCRQAEFLALVLRDSGHMRAVA
jgi:DNA-binding CsgD family transcriptional regulator